MYGYPRKILVFTLVSFFFLGCFNPKENRDKVLPANTIPSSKAKHKYTNSYNILEYLKKINKQFLPPVVKQYFDEKGNIKAELVDNRTVKFFTAEEKYARLVQIKLLKTGDNKDVLFISGIKKDSLNYQSYFYALGRQGNQFPNITLLIIPDKVIQIFKLELNTAFHYHHLYNFWAYISDASNYALDFDFHGDNAYVSSCFLSMGGTPEQCKVIMQLIWTGSKFIFKLITPKSDDNGLLSSQELEKVRRYISLEEAFKEPENVYILDLQDNGLTKLPDNISVFSHLQILILSNNYLDSLPTAIGSLPNLQVLRADGNHLKALPREMGNLRNLTELTLANNRLTWIPYEFARLEKLQKLDLSYNRLHVLAFDMSGLQKLYSLELQGNRLEKVPSQIFKLKNLIYLDLSENPIKVIPREFIFMKKLQYLVISKTLIDSSQVNYLRLKRPDLQIVY